MGIHTPFPQLPAPWNGISVSQALVLAHHAWSYTLEWLGIPSACTSGMCSWIQNFPVTLALGGVLGPLALTQLGGVRAHLSLEGLSHSINTCCPRGATAPRRWREWVHDKLWRMSTAHQVQMSFDQRMRFSVQSGAVRGGMWWGGHRTNWLLAISAAVLGHLMVLPSHQVVNVRPAVEALLTLLPATLLL